MQDCGWLLLYAKLKKKNCAISNLLWLLVLTGGLVGTLLYSSLRSHNLCNTPCLGIIYGEFCTALSVARVNQIMPIHTLPQSITLITDF